ncbi:Bug family tripartite tricarboxylate transporter substrate binding protein [Orrella sp. 11846]|uniref:Bug family tripartite tricarboxylate transporter substrate binding protein n=1 Tax=Orrella sp. 11846 TaxID=3409913 RepID=UPI003B5AFA64
MIFCKKTLTASLAVMTLSMPLAYAQDQVSKEQSLGQMHIIVPYAAGGTSDVLGRKLAQKLSDRLGQPVVVENRAGAGGSIGTQATVRSNPDGSTILLHSGAIATEPAIQKNLPYDATKDLRAITTVVRGPFALVVSNNLPVENVEQLLAYAKENPGKVNFGTPGVGTSVHFASEHFNAAANTKMTHVPYRGASAALAGLMGDEVQLVIDPLSTAKRYAEAGKIKALGLTTAQRSELWPGMNTVSEAGLPDFDASVWYGLYVPAKTPTETVERLNAEFLAILQDPEMREWLSEQGLEPVGDSAAESQAFLVKEIENWKALAESAGISIE